MIAWHMLRYGDDGRTPVLRGGIPAPTDGSWLTVEPPLWLCGRGLHASERLIDALQNAPGPVVCRVELAGELLRGIDKVCAQHRRILWWADASRVLRLWACDVAEKALRDRRVADERSWRAIEVSRGYAYGDATRQELHDAWDDARAARAARDAAWDARDAAWDAAKDAAKDAARDAARAARAAAGDAARDAAGDAQNADLTRRVLTRARSLGLTTEVPS